MDDFQLDLKRDFLIDAVDQLYNFQGILESGEKKGKLSNEDSQTIFRIIHTLKGNSQAAGFEDLGLMFHSFENLLSQLKDNKIAVDKKLFEVFFKVLSKLQDAIDAYQIDVEDNINFSEYIALVEAHKNPDTTLSKKYKIAVIDDDKSTREILMEVLSEAFNVEFFEFADANYILDIVRKTKFDLILTDYQMAILNGSEFIKILRLTDNINSLTPVLFITGQQPNIVEDKKVARDVWFIQKPFEFKRIIYYAKLSLSRN